MRSRRVTSNTSEFSVILEIWCHIMWMNSWSQPLSSKYKTVLRENELENAIYLPMIKFIELVKMAGTSVMGLLDFGLALNKNKIITKCKRRKMYVHILRMQMCHIDTEHSAAVFDAAIAVAAINIAGIIACYSYNWRH